MDIVVVPLFNRPEFFEVWCEVLLKARQAREMFYLFCCDAGYDRRHDGLIDRFPFDYGVIKTPFTQYRTGKQSYNVLNGLMVAARHSDGLVFYIEEDVFIARDFFPWHKEVQRQQPGLFCSIATRNNNTKHRTDGMLDHYYVTDRPDYQALGSCFRREVILEHIAPHFTEGYLRKPVDYCRYRFPGSRIGPYFCEQDGLIRRIMEEVNGMIAFPHVPRAFHGGLWGYNRRYDSVRRLNYEQRKEKIRQVAFNRELLKSFVSQPNFFTDSEPCDLDTDFVQLEQAPPLDK